MRSDAKLRCRYKVVSDSFLEVSLYGSLDTDANADAAKESKSDYGIEQTS